MAAKDIFHNNFKEALIKDGWNVTDDPLKISYGRADFKIDLGAEKVIAAEKGNVKIAVEIKSFKEPSFVYAFHEAFGQYMNYRRGLKKQNISRELFLAVPVNIYEAFFLQEMVQDAIKEDGMKVIAFNPVTKIIEKWIK